MRCLVRTPMEMLAAPIGLFAPLQIGRCPAGRAHIEGEPTRLPPIAVAALIMAQPSPLSALSTDS
jgi:hypothetical protein